MRKLRVADAEIMHVAIQQEIERSEEARYDHRLHGVLLVSQGVDCYTVAHYLGKDPVTIERWVGRFNARGFAGLREGEHPGRPTRLTPVQWAALEKDLRCSPREFGHGQNLWDGKLLSHHLAEHYDVGLSVRQCQRIFRRLKFRRRKPRPLIAHADPAAQAAYKKTPSPRARRKR